MYRKRKGTHDTHRCAIHVHGTRYCTGDAVEVGNGNQIGDMTLHQYLADLPPGIGTFLADQHETQLRVIDALEQQGARARRLEQEFRAYTTGEALERMERQIEQDRRQRYEQGLLIDGLNGMRAMIGDTQHDIRQLRYWFAGLLLAVIVLAAVLAAVVVDRTILNPVIGALLGLGYLWRRGA